MYMPSMSILFSLCLFLSDSRPVTVIIYPILVLLFEFLACYGDGPSFRFLIALSRVLIYI
jgi:hypothetical protein